MDVCVHASVCVSFCVCVCEREFECLAGSGGAWGSAMPPTVVHLGLVHALLDRVDP